ncbi:lipase family protein [Paenibacillus sp. N3.4]|uniref:lipase family protein n=1 Tax=Paenibacillus sp. N3.4 TaxID=2603222 RepID=UPI0011CAAD75|nr:lipase family protein [Paenibacillus sp. N3.4]TXK74089.1 lipase family protein [Paenibacillus sp. N3.4]
MANDSLDVRTAIFLAAMCGQSYNQFEHADGSFTVPTPYEVVAAFKATSFFGKKEWFGFIAESDDRVVLVFRGTNTKSDWISDAIARQTPYPYTKEGGLAHQGFLDIYSSARKQILTALNKLSAQKALYITGHSLGGALTALCAVDVAANTKFKAPAIYTFASPRAGNPVFARLFNQKTGSHFRIYNINDIVPELPPVLYTSPRTDKTYHYLHVKKAVELSFQAGSVSANHAIGSYFAELAKRSPQYVQQLCLRNPGFCPSMK